MMSPPNKSITDQIKATSKMLRELGFPIHRIGFHHLCIAIPQFALDFTQSLNSDIYPYIAEYYNCPDYRCIESSIRGLIFFAWCNGDAEVWSTYFSNLKKSPSNKLFIATLADKLK